jgi:hypothetical protein
MEQFCTAVFHAAVGDGCNGCPWLVVLLPSVLIQKIFAL